MLKKRSAFHQVPRALAHTKIQSVASGFPAHREDRFWTYEDPISIRFKASNASHQHLGGVMIWELSGDTADAELLKIAYRSLHDPLEERIFKERTRKRPLGNGVPIPRK